MDEGNESREEAVEVAEMVETPKAKPKAKPKVHAFRISGVRSGHVLFKGIINDESFFRLIPVNVWNGKDEFEFEEFEFLGYERPAFANR